MEIELNYLNIIIGTLIPLGVGLITKANASRKVKAWANAGLSALSAAVMTVVGACAAATCTITWEPFLSTLFVTYLTNIGTYYGLWKPTQTAAKVQAKTANLGVGGSKMNPLDQYRYTHPEEGSMNVLALKIAALVLAIIALSIWIINNL